MPLTSLMTQYMDSLLKGERARCRAVVEGALNQGVAARIVIEDLLWPAMEQVDKLFRDDRINVASEHMATRINRVLADQVQMHVPRSQPNGRRVVITCAHDEPEELGGQMCADLFEADGWDVYFVGGGVPHDEVLSLVGQLQPSVLVIFGSKPADAPRIRDLCLTIRDVNSAPSMNIIVSGGGFNRAEGLWQEVQADLFARNAQDALIQANETGPRAASLPVREGPKKRRRRRRTNDDVGFGAVQVARA